MEEKSDCEVKLSEENPRKLVPSSTDICNNINKLWDQQLIEILIRLPSCEFAIRCKCVSKRWLNLISSNFFISCFAWYRHKKPLPFARISQYSRDVKDVVRTVVYSKQIQGDLTFPDFNFDFLPRLRDDRGQRLPTRVSISGADKDLLLLSMQRDWSQGCVYGYPRHDDNYVICNPRTKQWVELPPIPFGLNTRVAFACEPYCLLDSDQGKCRVQDTYRYRVFSIQWPDTVSSLGQPPKLCVYKSETRQWEEFFVSCPHRSITLRLGPPPTVYNGKLHFLDVTYILAFDPFRARNDRVFLCRVIDLPVGVNMPDGKRYLGACSGSLRFCTTQRMGSASHLLKVWDLKDYDKGEWCLKHEFSTRDLMATYNSHRIIQTNMMDFMINVDMRGFHPYDMDIIYIFYANCIFECNMRVKTLQMVYECQGNGGADTFIDISLGLGIIHTGNCQIFFPWWPTPLPTLA